MTKAFGDKEKELIRNKLIEKGKELFERYGLKKTSIEDLTKAVGIAQGSYYNFFQSKEELYFEIMEQEEQYMKSRLLSTHQVVENLTKQSLEAFLTNAFGMIDESTFIKKLMNGEDYELLVRKLPEERIAKHIENDFDILTPMITMWQEQGAVIDRKPEVIGGLLRAVFTLSLHKKEIGEDIFQEVLELLIELIAQGIVKKEKL
ncbi:MAG: TetR/AcrR family transcriptional regulator [Clostridia bacterium]